MGCDVHSILQVKDYHKDYDGYWRTIAVGIFDDDHRDYDFFNFLGNEHRGSDMEGIRLSLRGLPEDLEVIKDENGYSLEINHVSDSLPLCPKAFNKVNSKFYLGEYCLNHISLKVLKRIYDDLKEDDYPSIIHRLALIINLSEYIVKSLTNIHELYVPYNQWAEKVRFVYGMDS